MTTVESVTSLINNELIRGDSLHLDTNNSILNEAKKRYNELKSKCDRLTTEISKKKKIIERVDRDFSDVNDTQPESNKTLRFIEDYTLAILSISYLFMILTIIYYYMSISKEVVSTLIYTVVGSLVISFIFFMMLYRMI